jgi:hypothetical protein
MRKNFTKIVAMGGLLLTAAPSVFAQSFISGNLSVTKVGSGGVSSISDLISAGFNLAILVAVIFVFGMLIAGGYGWISAGGDKGKVEEARTRITNALIGLAIIAAAWALIKIIGQFFGVNITNLQIPSAAGSTNNAL